MEGDNIPLTIGCCNIVYLGQPVGSGFGQTETNIKDGCIRIEYEKRDYVFRLSVCFGRIFRSTRKTRKVVFTLLSIRIFQQTIRHLHISHNTPILYHLCLKFLLGITVFSKIQLVVYYQSCVPLVEQLLGYMLYSPLVAKSAGLLAAKRIKV